MALGDCSYEDYTWIGTIVGVRGIKGEVRVKYYTDHPKYYLSSNVLFLENERGLLAKRVLKFRLEKKGWAIIFEGISTRDAAEEIKGYRLLIPDNQLKPLEKNEFFVHQLIGCRVEDKNGYFLGNIINLLETPANNVFEVQKGKKQFLVPDVPHIVVELDLKKRQMIIDPIPGLI
tara:strand:- start:155 stop:679 length:525 start_codon:yes stop_codon:yes gene_type:complete